MATTKVGIAPMKVAQIPKAGADFQIVEREIPTPNAGEVRKGPGLRRLPQRCAHERRPVARNSVSPHSRTRSRGHH